jgi:hypothetical protein
MQKGYRLTKNKHASREALRVAANSISEEVWEGKWNHVEGLRTAPIWQWSAVLDELERRCPGHTREEYLDAYSRSMVTWR